MLQELGGDHGADRVAAQVLRASAAAAVAVEAGQGVGAARLQLAAQDIALVHESSIPTRGAADNADTAAAPGAGERQIRGICSYGARSAPSDSSKAISLPRTCAASGLPGPPAPPAACSSARAERRARREPSASSTRIRSPSSEELSRSRYSSRERSSARAWRPAQRPPAAAPGAPGRSATRIASASAWPFAYVSIIAERRADAAAERRPEARTIHTIRPMRTTAASAIHSHSSDEPDPLAAGVEAAAGAGAVSGAWLAGGACAVGVGGPLVGRLMLAVRLGDRLEIALLMAPLTGPLPPHPAAKGPMTRAIAATARPFFNRLVLDMPASLLLARHRVLTRHGWPGQRGLRASIRNRWACETNAPRERMRRCMRASRSA